MEEEVMGWLEKAEHDLKAVEGSIKTKNYDWACFQAQQAAEKALKALFIKKYKKLWRIHDLVKLAEKINANKKVLNSCDELYPHYIPARYGVDVEYNKEDAERAFSNAKIVVKWIGKKLRGK